MLNPYWIVLALAVVLADGSLSAQDFAPGRPVTLGAVRFSVPSPYTAVPELSDSGSLVYGDAASRTWVLVAHLRRVEERRTVIHNLLRRFGSAVLGGDPDTLDWQLAPDFPENLAFPFHQRLEAMGGPQILDISFVQLHSAGTDVLVGSAFIPEGEARSLRCGEWVSLSALDAQYWVIASLLGRPLIERSPLEGRGPMRRVVWSGPPDPSQPADPEAAPLVSLYDAYVAATREHRRPSVAELVAPAVIEYYADLRRLALYGAASEVRALPVFQRLQVLRVRQMYDDAARLAALDRRELFAISSEAAGHSLTAGTPRVHERVAFMDLRSDGSWTPWWVGFLRSDRGWTLDPLPLGAVQGCILRGSLRRSGVSRAQEDSVLVQDLRAGGRVPDDIWQPMVRDGARSD